MRTYKEFVYLEEGKGKVKAAEKALKAAAKKGRGGWNAVKKALGLGATTGIVAKGTEWALDRAGDAAKAAANQTGKIWKGGENKVDSGSAPSDHQGLPTVN